MATITLLIATLSFAVAFESPIISSSSKTMPQTTHLFSLPTESAESNNNDDTPPTMEDNTAAEDKSWANTAYSGLSNVWGYSRSVVNDR